MSLSVSIWFVIVLALLAANLPFFSQRLFGFVALRTPKSLTLRLGELLVMYFVAGGVGVLLEHRAGQDRCEKPLAGRLPRGDDPWSGRAGVSRMILASW